MKYRPSRRTRRTAIAAAVVLAIAGFNGPALYGIASEQYHDYTINKPGYKAERGHWKTLDVPRKYRINTIHAALLHTGKVLLVAGSGNDAKQFKAKTFRSVLWDPAKNTFKNIPTPKDLFCSGHTQLPDGRLLVAGGTRRYEKLDGDVKKAGGLMIVHNENPDRAKTLEAGTLFTGRENGKTFESQDNVLVPRAKKRPDPVTGRVEVTPSVARVYVEAAKRGKRRQTGTEDNYRVHGLRGIEKKNVYGIAQKLSFDKKDFQGIKDTFEFDPVAERYITVDPMHEARWYPSLTTLEDGKVLSVSGLDEIGQVVPGKNEIYDPATGKWRFLPRKRFFPTYPALHLTSGNGIFYSGANAGYGPDDKGRAPGLWNLETNGFRKIPGMSDPDALETAMSLPLPPTQRGTYMVLGGGGVGESKKATAKTRLVDLKDPDPRFRDGPDLYAEARYPSSVILPDDTVLTTNGSGDYRGRGDSNVLKAEIYDPGSNTMKAAADPLVGRNYHSGALLLPDGRVMTFGSDSLYSDETNTKPGRFEQQIDIYTPPYLHRKGGRPELTDPGQAGRAGQRGRTVRLGGSATYGSKDAGTIKRMRLIRPSSFTHVSNLEQSSVALDFKKTAEGVRVTLPNDPSLVPPGWWMLTAVDDKGVPSKSVWLKVPRSASATSPTTTRISP